MSFIAMSTAGESGISCCLIQRRAHIPVPGSYQDSENVLSFLRSSFSPEWCQQVQVEQQVHCDLWKKHLKSCARRYLVFYDQGAVTDD